MQEFCQVVTKWKYLSQMLIFLVNICFNDFTQEILESQHKNGRKNWCEKIFHMGREKGGDTWLEWWKEPMCVKYVVKKKLA